jgi:hypothetical protein
MPPLKNTPEWDEWRRKISVARKGKPIHENTIKAVAEANHRRGQSTESRQKISETMTGMTRPSETRIRMSEAQKGKHPSEETRKKMSVNSKRLWENPDFAQRQSDFQKLRFQNPKNHPRYGTKHTAESRRKMRESHKGCKPTFVGRAHTEETIAILIDIKRGGLWYGAVTYEENPYCDLWTPELRRRNRFYMGNVCLLCGSPPNGHDLHVHHVYWNKKTCCDNSKRYLVPLCRSCHFMMRGNHSFTRKDWIDYLSRIIEDYYEGKCFYTKEEFAIIGSAPYIPPETRYIIQNLPPPF